MKVYLKKHVQELSEVFAACDEDLLGKSIGKISINERFYKGKLMEIPDALKILEHAQNFNIIGKNIIKACVDNGIIVEDSYLKIENIPLAMKIFI